MAVDLRKVVERISREYFGGTLHPRIRWGVKPKVARRHRMHMCAYYDPVEYRITMHPMFKSPRVPIAVIEYLVYHESLHILWGPGHSLGFRNADKAHPDYWRVDKWLGYHLNGLSMEAGKR